MIKLAFALSIVLVAPASASVVFSNLAEPDKAISDLSTTLWASQSFGTGSASGTLVSIRTKLGSNAPVNWFAELRSGEDPTGATVLTRFLLPSLPTSPGIVTLVPGSTVTLAVNTTYSIVIGVTSDAVLNWTYANGSNYVGPGNGGNYFYSTNFGSSWSNFGNFDPYLFEVNIAAVPELASWAMLIAGFGMVGAAMRRRNMAIAA